MFKTVHDRVWAFDLEWVPDPLAGRLVYGLDEELAEIEVLAEMWRRGGATDDDPQPFLKTSVCRIVSVAAIERRRTPDGSVVLNLMSLPRDPEDLEQVGEHAVVGTFLDALSTRQPQLVGFNSLRSDVPILLQRGLIHGLSAPGFCRRPDKPWEGIDYFARSSEWHVDLKDLVAGWGKGSPSLHELAVQSGIPGKMETEGAQVAELWLNDDLRRIVEYNQFDALTTYLVWLRMAHMTGHFSGEQYAAEQALVEQLVQREITSGARPYLQLYLDEWQRLQLLIADRLESPEA